MSEEKYKEPIQKLEMTILGLIILCFTSIIFVASALIGRAINNESCNCSNSSSYSEILNYGEQQEVN